MGEQADWHVRRFFDYRADMMLAERRIDDVGDLLDTLIMEQDPTAAEPSRIILRRLFCEHQYPMPERAPFYVREAVKEARVVCMREREEYIPPREAPPSKRFPLEHAYGALKGANRAIFFCRPVSQGGCARPIARKVLTISGDLPRAYYCECGSDAEGIRRMNGELDRATRRSRAFWASLPRDDAGNLLPPTDGEELPTDAQLAYHGEVLAGAEPTDRPRRYLNRVPWKGCNCSLCEEARRDGAPAEDDEGVN